MKKITFDIIVILITGVILLILNQYGLLEPYAKYLFIPMIVLYFIGQYAERKFK